MSSHPSISSVGHPADRDNTGPLPVWWTSAAGALLICLGWMACVWISTHLRADPALHTAALFVHLASLVLGFGAVLVADYYGLLWLTGRCELGEAVGCASRLHTPIWAGLSGLVASGIMLHPDLASPLTRIKLALVLLLSLNGLQAGILRRRIAGAAAASPSPRTLMWGAATALMSQVCWWGALAIGFLNSQG
ncbi:hypothetical protein [Streptomyces sp.]|uniref:hypothetical protein n=1 Tax=Streptomyces sp. TaxID=1931 RepID=UPI002D79DD2C|nr:hypothetical protein [Streptomyces sp.]HET6353637.1 hypothetical protein [Streptomyces sp.]